MEDAGAILQMSHRLVFVFRDDALRFDMTIKTNAITESLDEPDYPVDRHTHSLEDILANSNRQPQYVHRIAS